MLLAGAQGVENNAHSKLSMDFSAARRGNGRMEGMFPQIKGGSCLQCLSLVGGWRGFSSTQSLASAMKFHISVSSNLCSHRFGRPVPLPRSIRLHFTKREISVCV